MKATSPNPKLIKAMPFAKAEKFKPAKKIAKVHSFKKGVKGPAKSTQKKALLSGIGANGQPIKYKKDGGGQVISSLD